MTVEFIAQRRKRRKLVMITLLIIESVLLLMPYLLGNVTWLDYLQKQKMPEPKLLHTNSENIEFNNHLGIDWLVATVAITGSILSLVASDRLVYKLKKRKIDWRNVFK